VRAAWLSLDCRQIVAGLIAERALKMQKLASRSRSVSKIRLLSTTFFLAKIGLEAASLGSLVYVALLKSGTNGTIVVAALQALGSILALIISLAVGSKLTTRISLNCYVLAVICSAFFAALLVPTTPLWYCAIFIRQLFGIVLTARLSSLVRELDEDRVIENNKSLQTAGMFSLVIGWTIGPIIAATFGSRELFIGDTLISLAILVPLYYLLKDAKISEPSNKSTKGITTLSKPFSDRDLSSTLILTSGMFLAAGAFHVVEVPFLTQYLKVQPYQISLVYLVAAVCNLVSVRIMPVGAIQRSAYKYLATSTIVLVALTAAYLFMPGLVSVVFLVSIFGFANGAFILSQTSIIQQIPEEHVRTNGFILLKFFAYLGMLLSTIATFANDLMVVRTHLLYLSGTVILVVVSLSIWRATQLRSRSKISSILILTVTLLSGALSHASEFVVPVHSLPKDMNPAASYDTGSNLVFGQIFDTLYEYTETNALRPVLAKSHIIAGDGLSIRITIDTNRVFSDGSKLTATDVVSSLQKAATQLGKDGEWALGSVVGFDRFLRASGDPSVLGISAPNDHEVLIRFTKPNSLMLQILTAKTFSIVKLNSTGKLIGTGAYEISENLPNRIKLKRSRNNLNEKAPDQINFPQTASYTGSDSMIPNGFDLVQIVTKNQKLDSSYSIVEYKFLQTLVLLLNQTHPEFADRNYRCYFIKNFSKVAQEAKYEWNPISTGLPFSWNLFEEIKVNEQALRKNHRATVFYGDTTSTFSDTLNAKISGIFKESGTNLSLKRLPVSDLIKRAREKTAPAILIGYAPDYIDPDAYLTPMVMTKQQYNFFRYSNPTVDALLELAHEMSSRADRSLVYKKVFQILGNDCTVGFLGTQPGLIAVSNNWKIPGFSSLGLQSLKFANITRKESKP
jgi:ABC-type transport system substrate-binding protein